MTRSTITTGKGGGVPQNKPYQGSKAFCIVSICSGIYSNHQGYPEPTWTRVRPALTLVDVPRYRWKSWRWLVHLLYPDVEEVFRRRYHASNEWIVWCWNIPKGEFTWYYYWN